MGPVGPGAGGTPGEEEWARTTHEDFLFLRGPAEAPSVAPGSRPSRTSGRGSRNLCAVGKERDEGRKEGRKEGGTWRDLRAPGLEEAALEALAEAERLAALAA